MSQHDENLLASLIAEIQDAANRGENPDIETYCANHPQFADEIRSFFEFEVFFEDALEHSGEVPVLPGGEGDDARLDLEAFNVMRRLSDIGLGSTYLLKPEDGVQRELVVLRSWFTPLERSRIEDTLRRVRALKHGVFLPVLEIGRLNQIPFVVRQHNPGPSLATLTAMLRAGRGEEGVDAIFRDWMKDRDLALPEPCASLGEISGRLVRNSEHLGFIAGMFSAWAHAFDEVHREGFVHRGVVPSLLMLSPKGVPLVQGMGLSWHGTEISLSRMKGWSPAWCPPEFFGDRNVPVTWQADVFGLGACLWSALTLERRPPPVASPADLVDFLPADTPPPLRELLTAALSSDLEERPANALDFAASLEASVGSCKYIHEVCGSA